MAIEVELQKIKDRNFRSVLLLPKNLREAFVMLGF
jgi:hypothetical protein